MSHRIFQGEGADNLRWKGVRSLLCQSPHPGQRHNEDEKNASNWKWVGPGKGMNFTEEKVFCLYLEQYTKGWSPGIKEPKWRPEAIWPQDRQDLGREESQTEGLRNGNGAGRGQG